MPQPLDSQPGFKASLLKADQFKVMLTQSDPDYGKDFTDQEWANIALRLEHLTRLIVRTYRRKALAGEFAQSAAPTKPQPVATKPKPAAKPKHPKKDARLPVRAIAIQLEAPKEIPQSLRERITREAQQNAVLTLWNAGHLSTRPASEELDLTYLDLLHETGIPVEQGPINTEAIEAALRQLHATQP